MQKKGNKEKSHTFNMEGRILNASLYVCIILFLATCKNTSTEMPENAVVKTNNKILVIDELKKMIPPGLDSVDSVEIAHKYIKKWITQELIADKAIFNVGTSDQEINRLVREYRNSLIVKKYKEELLEKKAEIEPNAEEIAAFYEANKGNYLLKEDIIEGIVLKVPLDAPKLKDLRKWLKESSIEDLAEVESYSYQHATMYDDFTEKWIPFEKIESLFPEKFKSHSKAIQNTEFLEQQDTVYAYLLKITSFMLKKDTAPQSFVHQNITTILRHKKKLDFFQKLEKDIYNEGIKNETVIYNPLYE